MVERLEEVAEVARENLTAPRLPDVVERAESVLDVGHARVVVSVGDGRVVEAEPLCTLVVAQAQKRRVVAVDARVEVRRVSDRPRALGDVAVLVLLHPTLVVLNQREERVLGHVLRARDLVNAPVERDAPVEMSVGPAPVMALYGKNQIVHADNLPDKPARLRCGVPFKGRLVNICAREAPAVPRARQPR